jgi:hypothetical protein
MEIVLGTFLGVQSNRTDGRAVCKAIDIKKMEATIIRGKVPFAVLEQNKKECICASKIH